MVSIDSSLIYKYSDFTSLMRESSDELKMAINKVINIAVTKLVIKWEQGLNTSL